MTSDENQEAEAAVGTVMLNRVQVYLVGHDGEHRLVGTGQLLPSEHDQVRAIVLDCPAPGGIIPEAVRATVEYEERLRGVELPAKSVLLGSKFDKAIQALATMHHSLTMQYQPTDAEARWLEELANGPQQCQVLGWWPEPERVTEPWQEHNPARGQHRRNPERPKPQLLASTRHAHQKQRKAQRKASKRARSSQRRK